MSYLKFGSRGDEVREVQIALQLKVDGIYGRMTEAAVKNYQIKKGLHPDGAITSELFNDLIGKEITTDRSEQFIDYGKGLQISRHYLDRDEFVTDYTTNKEYIFLHHTAGANNPYATIDDWNNDNRGRIGTQYVIGGVSLSGNDNYDGEIVECFPSEYWAYHLGRVDPHMHSHSVGIEICNYGWLTRKAGRFYNYKGRQVPKEQVHTLPTPFRGYQYYHDYTRKQIDALALLIPYIGKKHGIDITRGLKEWTNTLSANDSLEYRMEAVTGQIKGVLSHTNVRKDKTDIYPHSRLIRLLKHLGEIYTL